MSIGIVFNKHVNLAPMAPMLEVAVVS